MTFSFCFMDTLIVFRSHFLLCKKKKRNINCVLNLASSSTTTTKTLRKVLNLILVLAWWFQSSSFRRMERVARYGVNPSIVIATIYPNFVLLPSNFPFYCFLRHLFSLHSFISVTFLCVLRYFCNSLLNIFSFVSIFSVIYHI